MCLKGGATCSENGRHKNSLPDSSSSRAAHGAVFDEPSEACDGMRSARAFSIECSLPALFQGRNRINRPEGISPTRRGIRHDVKCGPQGTASTPGPTGRHPLLLRADIDRSDEAIVGALRTRLGAVRRIAEVKRLQGLPVYDAVREASLLYKLRSMAGSDVEGVALPVYRTMMAAARRFEAQSQEAGEAVSGTVTLRLRSPADFTAVTEIFAVHDYVPESLSWVNPVIVLSATKPLPASMVRDLREHGIRIEAQDA